MNIIPDEEKLIGKTIVFAEIGGYGIRLKFNNGSILDYSSSSDGDSCWAIIDDTKQAETDKLKPCPFCGSEAEINGRDRLHYWFIQCIECGATQYGEETKEDVIKAWNRRAERNEE